MSFARRTLRLVCLVTLAAITTWTACSRGGGNEGPLRKATGPSGPPAAAAAGSQELSEEAQKITFVTRRAAERGNFVALRRFLADDYRWAGPDQQVADHLTGDQAIEKWKEHMELLATLVTIVDQGCRPDGTDHVLCPPQALTDEHYKGYAAGYTFKGSEWKMTSFENHG